VSFDFKDTIQKLFLFVCLIYGLIPFEASFSVGIFHGFALSCIMAYALILNKFQLNKYTIIYILFFLFVALVNSIISVGQDIILLTVSLLFSGIIVPILYSNKRFRNQFITAIKWLIVISVVMFYLQYITYTINGNILSIHEVIFPFSHARISQQSLYDGLTRMGGMYIEPGTYANFMYVYLLIYMILTKNFKNLFVYITLLSIILSFSVWGMMFASFFLVILLISNFNTISKYKKMILLVLFLISGFYLSNYIMKSSAVKYALTKTTMGKKNKSESVSAKSFVYKKYAQEYESLLVIGEGFKPEFRNNTTSLQDAGVLLNISIVFGIPFAIFFFITFIIALYKITNFWILIGSLPVFISKLYYWDPAIYLLYFLVVYKAFCISNKISYNKKDLV